MSPLCPGDHLLVRRMGGLYRHHSIYEGHGWVIHYTGEPGDKRNARIARAPLARFIDGDPWTVVRYGRCDPPAVVVHRAQSRLGERSFSLMNNNCEHFARWCKTGRAHSEQVQRSTAVGVGTVAGRGAIGVGVGTVAAGGAVSGLSGAGLMSGLAAVGGSATGGLAAGSLAPTAIALRTIDRVYEDDPVLLPSERQARRNSRAAGRVGAGAGAVGALTVVSAAGMPGLSAAGITSGLSAVGSVVGGGMLAGAMTVFALPAATALLFSWLASQD